MSNTISDGALRQLWMQGVQEDLDKKLVAKGIGIVDSRAARIFHNPFNSTPVGTNGVKQSTYTTEDMTSTDDTLTVNQRAAVSEQIDNFEQIMADYDLMSQQERRQAYRLADYIDQYILNLPVSATGVRQVDNGVISSGTSDSSGYALSSSNANTAANTLAEFLALGNAALENGLFWVVSPYDMTAITAYAQSHGFNLEDAAITGGYLGSAGKKFAGMDLFVSNNLTHSTDLTLSTEPTDGDTLTLMVLGRAIKFTFRTSPSVAGDVKIGGSASGAQGNIKLAINGTGVGDGTDYTELGSKDRWTLQQAAPQSAPGTYAICGSFSTNVATLTFYGSVKTAASLTHTADGFSTVIRHSIAGVKGSIFLALPGDGMAFKTIDVSGKHGKEVSTSQIYDATIWNNEEPEILNVLLS